MLRKRKVSPAELLPYLTTDTGDSQWPDSLNEACVEDCRREPVRMHFEIAIDAGNSAPRLLSEGEARST